jgi:hypothetical protein
MKALWKRRMFTSSQLETFSLDFGNSADLAEHLGQAWAAFQSHRAWFKILGCSAGRVATGDPPPPPPFLCRGRGDHMPISKHHLHFKTRICLKRVNLLRQVKITQIFILSLRLYSQNPTFPTLSTDSDNSLLFPCILTHYFEPFPRLYPPFL